MEIFNIGLGEMVVIFIIALIVFGPDRLPEVGRQAGRMLREFRKMTAEVTEQVQRELELVEEPMREVREITTEARAGIQREIDSVQQPVREVRESLASINREMKGKALPDQEPANTSSDQAASEQTTPTPDESVTTADQVRTVEVDVGPPSDQAESISPSASADGSEAADADGAGTPRANGERVPTSEPSHPSATPPDQIPPSEGTTH